ncbi:tRNA synthetases class I (M)-domain-containing protein [Gaertneriomyces semiglobifer]|nr:tRNA synthetases class I (M)-domain-containing protein [Gaertneriomyces semiglobifer]
MALEWQRTLLRCCISKSAIARHAASQRSTGHFQWPSNIGRQRYSTNSLQKERPVFITTPIFYANAEPHIGHLYSAVLADTFKRWHDFKGHQTVLSTGTDEHGQKIQEAALKAKKDTKEFCDSVSAKFRVLFDKAGISYTDYLRTTDVRHKTAVQTMWKSLAEAGYIYKGYHQGWYSVSDEVFCSPSHVEEIKCSDGTTAMVSKETGSRLIWMKEENYKFRLSSLRTQLLSWLQENPECIIPQTRYNEILTMVAVRSEEQLADISISRVRSRVTWGIPVPDDDKHVIYVWLDALVNYLTVLGYPWKNSAALRDAWPAQCHVIGKDILKFHAIYWPAFLIAAGLKPPKRIVAHAHWLMKKHKMSKSRGNVVDPNKLLDDHGVDLVRYWLMRDGGISEDADYSERTIHMRFKKDLAAQLGNLVMRCTAPKINPGMIVPMAHNELTEADQHLLAQLEQLPALVESKFTSYDVSHALAATFDMISSANKYWDAQKPWTLVASPNVDHQLRLQTILYVTLETVRITALLLQPVMPRKMAELLDAIGVDAEARSWRNAKVGGRFYGAQAREVKLGIQTPLFPMR